MRKEKGSNKGSKRAKIESLLKEFLAEDLLTVEAIRARKERRLKDGLAEAFPFLLGLILLEAIRARKERRLKVLDYFTIGSFGVRKQ